MRKDTLNKLYLELSDIVTVESTNERALQREIDKLVISTNDLKRKLELKTADRDDFQKELERILNCRLSAHEEQELRRNLAKTQESLRKMSAERDKLLVKVTKIIDISLSPSQALALREEIRNLRTELDNLKNPPKSVRCEHRLKSWPEPFKEISLGIKTFDIRKNDRDFQVNDTILFQEWHPKYKTYTNGSICKLISYIVQGEWGLPEDLCVLGLEDLKPY